MTDWQPIETAPKDGTNILLWDEDLVRYGWFDDGAMTWRFLDPTATPDHLNGWIEGYGPSHWMPIPEPPK